MKQEGTVGFEGESTAGLDGSLVMAAHELKAPLALIRQLTIGLELASDPLEKRQLQERIRLTAERSLRMTSDITVAARQDTLFELEPIQTVQFCQEVVRELSPLFAAKGRSIGVRTVRRAPLAVAHRELLRRVLVNFGDNALHYAPEASHVEFSISTHGNFVRLGVRDYGPALPRNTWKRIAGALQKSTPHPVSTRPQSSGLGLYLSQQFADKMDSSIGIVRHRDGTTFYIDLMASRQLLLL